LPPHGSPAEIRPARAEDAGAIAEIWRLGWHDGHDGLVPQELVDVRTPESFHERAAQRVPDTTIAAVEGAVAGFVMVVDDELEQMYVSADHRGTGLAQALIAEAERQVRANGHAKAWLAVVAGNARARRFYERTEWVDEGGFEYEAAAGDRTVFVPCRRYTKLL
jgi:GNAT superfamily N-acetyltransferase